MNKTINDLPDDTDIQKIKVRLSEHLYEASSLPGYDIESREVYIVGHMMGDFFVKTNLEETQVYPMFNDMINWNDLKDLELVDDGGEDKNKKEKE